MTEKLGKLKTYMGKPIRKLTDNELESAIRDAKIALAFRKGSLSSYSDLKNIFSPGYIGLNIEKNRREKWHQKLLVKLRDMVKKFSAKP